MSVTTGNPTRSWTCDRCDVTIRYLPGHGPSGPPAGWSVEDGVACCLACRRDLAAEAALSHSEAELTWEERAKLRARGRLEFEIKRDPERTNGEIAKAVRCSAAAVLKARSRLEGAEPA
jgi:hypothetical protein